MSRNVLTLPRAQRELGIDGPLGRKLKRMILAKEKKLGREIMIRVGGKRRVGFRVTMASLRRYMPELFPSKVDDLAKNFRDYLAGIDERIGEKVAEHMAEQVEPRLRELWNRDEVLAESVEALAKRLEKLARAVL